MDQFWVGLSGIVLGALITGFVQRHLERTRWLRERRMVAYQRYILAFSSYWADRSRENHRELNSSGAEIQIIATPKPAAFANLLNQALNRSPTATTRALLFGFIDAARGDLIGGRRQGSYREQFEKEFREIKEDFQSKDLELILGGHLDLAESVEATGEDDSHSSQPLADSDS